MIFSSGLSVPEGPVLLDDNSWLVVEMGAERGCITHISEDGLEKRIIARTGRPNSLAVDKHGVIWVAESKVPSLVRLTMDGKSEVFLTECNGESFLFPNDLVFGPDGDLYMTDSGVLVDEFAPNNKVRSDYMDVFVDGRVYKIDVKTKRIQKIDSGIQFTNGIVFGPDNNLYVDETITGMIYFYKWENGKIVSRRKQFANVIDPVAPKGWKGPDGMKFGMDGNLYVAVCGQGEITILGSNGEVINRIKTEGNSPTNCAFGPNGTRKLYVTEDEKGTVECFEVDTDGFPLYRGI